MSARDPFATIVVPRGAEAAAVRRAVRTLAGDGRLRVVAVPAGAAAAGAVPATLAEPLLVTGLCGALRDRTVGDVVVYRRVTGASGAIELDAALAQTLLAIVPGAHAVTACSTGHVVTTRAERAALAAAHGADVVDMEAFELATALATGGRRFAMLRVVSDDAARDLPPLERAIGADGRLHVGQLAFAFARRPRAALAFVRDVRRALATLSATASTLARAGEPR